MVIAIFRSRLRPDAGQEYAALAAEMLSLAEAMPGFLSFTPFTARDGERVSIIEFDSMEALEAWRDHPEHQKAQQRGRDHFYAEYRIQICEVVRAASLQTPTPFALVHAAPGSGQQERG